jgi:hypothetical protein
MNPAPIQGWKLSPDGFSQMIFQLAYYRLCLPAHLTPTARAPCARVQACAERKSTAWPCCASGVVPVRVARGAGRGGRHGRMGATYESCSTRRFAPALLQALKLLYALKLLHRVGVRCKTGVLRGHRAGRRFFHGRTECIRSAHEEARDMCVALSADKRPVRPGYQNHSASERYELVRPARRLFWEKYLRKGVRGSGCCAWSSSACSERQTLACTPLPPSMSRALL